MGANDRGRSRRRGRGPVQDSKVRGYSITESRDRESSVYNTVCCYKEFHMVSWRLSTLLSDPILAHSSISWPVICNALGL